MAFSLREFVKSGLLLAVGKKPDYEIKLMSAEWLKNGILFEIDLEEIEAAIANQYALEDDVQETDIVIEE